MKYLFYLLFVINSSFATVVHLTPPIISQATVQEKLTCVRPGRQECNISIESKAEKTIVHCYGHGASGWSNLFASVNKAIALLLEKHRNTPIRIIGSGCMGLTTAIELDRLGYKVAGIYTKSLYDIPSWRAGGYFSPENELGIETFKVFQSIERGFHPYLSKDTVRYLPVYCDVGTNSGLDILEENQLIPPREPVSIDFGNGALHRHFYRYMTYFMNLSEIMKQLTAEVSRRKITIDIQQIAAFNEVEENIIFNCTGLGSRELNDDKDVAPIRGHLITFNEAAGSGHMDYMLCTKVDNLPVYMFPKELSVTSQHPEGIPCNGVLGGTFIKGELTEEQDALEFKKILDRSSKFFHNRPFEE